MFIGHRSFPEKAAAPGCGSRFSFRSLLGAGLLRPLDLGDVGVALLDGCLKVGLGAVVVHVALEVVAESVLDQLHAALVIGGQRRDLDVLGHGGKVLVGVLTAQEVRGKGGVGSRFLHAADGVGEVEVIAGDLGILTP